MLIKIVKKLIDSNLSAYEIGKNTGVDPASIRKIRRGERTVENLSFETGEKLYNYTIKLEESNKMRNIENEKSYVVNLDKHDKDVSVTTKEGDMYFEYFIKPEYLKDVEYLVDLIKDENLDSLFYGEEITDNEPLTFDYTIEEVETFLEKAK